MQSEADALNQSSSSSSSGSQDASLRLCNGESYVWYVNMAFLGRYLHRWLNKPKALAPALKNFAMLSAEETAAYRKEIRDYHNQSETPDYHKQLQLLDQAHKARPYVERAKSVLYLAVPVVVGSFALGCALSVAQPMLLFGNIPILAPWMVRLLGASGISAFVFFAAWVAASKRDQTRLLAPKVTASLAALLAVLALYASPLATPTLLMIWASASALATMVVNAALAWKYAYKFFDILVSMVSLDWWGRTDLNKKQKALIAFFFVASLLSAVVLGMMMWSAVPASLSGLLPASLSAALKPYMGPITGLLMLGLISVTMVLNFEFSRSVMEKAAADRPDHAGGKEFDHIRDSYRQHRGAVGYWLMNAAILTGVAFLSVASYTDILDVAVNVLGLAGSSASVLSLVMATLSFAATAIFYVWAAHIVFYPARASKPSTGLDHSTDALRSTEANLSVPSGAAASEGSVPEQNSVKDGVSEGKKAEKDSDVFKVCVGANACGNGILGSNFPLKTMAGSSAWFFFSAVFIAISTNGLMSYVAGSSVAAQKALESEETAAAKPMA